MDVKDSIKYRRSISFFRPAVNFLWPLQIIDRHKFVEGKGVYVCNHYSVFDSLHFVTDLFKGRTNLLMKEEAMRTYVGIKFLNYMGAIPIKREELDIRAIKTCMTVLRSDKPLVIFPEGTRNRSGDKNMAELKDGTVVFAIKTKAPIYPFMYYRAVRFFRRSYLIVGDKIDLSMYYDQKINDVRADATDYVRAEMEKLRVRLDDIVETKGKLKGYKKQDKIENKRRKDADKLAMKRAKQNAKNAKKAVIADVAPDNEVN